MGVTRDACANGKGTNKRFPQEQGPSASSACPAARDLRGRSIARAHRVRQLRADVVGRMRDSIGASREQIITLLVGGDLVFVRAREVKETLTVIVDID